ncbi:hypothetical protein [Streptomyces sp. NPDC094140]
MEAWASNDQDQDDVAGPVRLPLTAEQAREVTAGLREAMDDVRRSVAVLAARVRDAHGVRVWLPLGYSSWESYCDAEFGISRAQAYRLLDVARALAAIHGAVAASTEMSRTRDTSPAAAAALDYGLSQRALIAASARSSDVAELINCRLATLTHGTPQALDLATVRAVVRQAVRDISATPPVPSGHPPADPALATLRQAVDDLAARTYEIGALMLEVAPGYLCDREAAAALVPLCDEIGIDLDHGLAARRYALTSDRRGAPRHCPLTCRRAAARAKRPADQRPSRGLNPDLEVKSADLQPKPDVAPGCLKRGDMADQGVGRQKFHDQVPDAFTARSRRRRDPQVRGIHPGLQLVSWPVQRRPAAWVRGPVQPRRP